MKENRNNSLEQFLNELERWILRQETAIELVKTEQKEKHYIEDLLDVLNTSKIGFVKELLSSNEEKQEEFQRIIKKVISNDREYHEILDEIRNLYFLYETELINRQEAYPQVEKALFTLNIIIEKAKSYLESLNISESDAKLEKLYQDMEKLISLAMSFDENGLVNEIEDLDFFQDLLFKLNLSDKARVDITSYIFNRSNELSKKTPSPKKKYNAYRELEYLYEENIGENTEELLDELLEATPRSR